MFDACDLPDPADDTFYRGYVKSCRLAGIERVSRSRMRDLVGEWNRTFGAAVNATEIGPQRRH